jgi:hypothetical protein
MIPSELLHNGTRKSVENWEAEWSLGLDEYPHLLWIKFAGEPKYTRFTSDSRGSFAELDEIPNA